MDCPRCARPLSRSTADGVDVGRCDGCRGMFLAHGALNRISGAGADDIEYSTVSRDSFSHADAFPAAACPHCRTSEMRKVEFNIYTDIILDWCPGCGGFWLDTREIDRIREEIRELNEAARDMPDPPMLWLARFIWSLPF